MALAALSGDEQCIIFSQLCNVLDPGVAVGYGSTNSELRALTQAQRQQLRADHEAAAALCCDEAGMRSCKELREAKEVEWNQEGLSATDLVTLGSMGSVLPALEELYLREPTAGPDGVQRLAERLGAGALPAVTKLVIVHMHMSNAGASALAAALGRGALPRLKELHLTNAAIGDAGLVALAPALRRMPALKKLGLVGNPLGDEGFAALVAPPPAGSPTGVLQELEELDLGATSVTEKSIDAYSVAKLSSRLPAMEKMSMGGTPAHEWHVQQLAIQRQLAIQQLAVQRQLAIQQSHPWHPLWDLLDD